MEDIIKPEVSQTTTSVSQKDVGFERQAAATEFGKRAHLTALRLWGQLLFNVESFPKEKFVSLDAALDRAGSSLDVLRKEVFTLYFWPSSSRS